MEQHYAIMAETLRQIAAAIRDKTSSTDTILARTFAEKIAEVPTYITVQSEADLPADAKDGTLAVVTGN